MEMFVIAALVGVGVGVLSGLLGIGGGTIMVPLFRLAFGLEPIMATATSLFTIVPTSISGMAKHVRNKTSLPRVGVLCGVAGAFLSPVGVWAAAHSPNWMIMAAAALVIVYSSFTMFKKALAKPKDASVSRAPEHSGPSADFAPAFAASAGDSGQLSECASCASNAASEGAAVFGASASNAVPEGTRVADALASQVKLTPAFCAKAVFIGVIAGFMSGYVGVGGGFIMVPLFVSMLGIPMRLASGTSLAAVCILAVPGVVEQGVLGNIDYAVGIAMAIGTIPGAVVGASLVKRVPERTLKLIFACFLLVVAVILMVNELGLMG